MSGFCGWFNASGRSGGQPVLDAMERGIFDGTKLRTNRIVDSRACVVAASNLPGALYFTPSELMVAVDGRPRWESESLQQLVVRRGWGVSLAEAYRGAGEGFLRDLKGSFSVAVIDLKVGRVLLAIDRAGIHSLAYAHTKSGIVFGTSLDSLRNHPSIDTTIKPQAIYRYMMGFVSPAPCTMYDQCHKLLPAHKLVWEGGSTKTQSYWHVPYGTSSAKPFPELRDELFSVLNKGVARASEKRQSGHTLGAFLSGGLDSSAVCGLMQKQSNHPISAFTVTFEDDQYDESTYARTIARHFGLKHYEYRLSPNDVRGIILELPKVFDEPFGNNSAIPSYYCAKFAKDMGIDLILAGDGGDELFAGNKRYVEQKILSFYHGLPQPLRFALEVSVAAFPEKLTPSLLAKCRRYINRAKLPMPERMQSVEHFSRQKLASIFTDDAISVVDIEQPYELSRRHFDESGSDDLVYSMMHFDMRTALADNDLRKVGRTCDLAGLEVAFPFLDDDLIEYAAKIPSDLLIKGLELRYFFRKAMEGFLPQNVIKKKKHGFAMPFWQWAKRDDRLVEIVDSCFEGLNSRRVFRRDFLDRVLQGHRGAEQTNLNSIIYDLVMLELWQRERERG